ncbi:hypothetical protein ElyMa_004452100, partial [Elysia marginata]
VDYSDNHNDDNKCDYEEEEEHDGGTMEMAVVTITEKVDVTNRWPLLYVNICFVSSLVPDNRIYITIIVCLVELHEFILELVEPRGGERKRNQNRKVRSKLTGQICDRLKLVRGVCRHDRP